MYKYLSLILLVLPLSLAAQYYAPDPLGSDFEQHTFEMGADYGGEVVSTLVRALPVHDTDRAVLYVHGYNDYFFQSEMARRFNDSSYNFYALDLRRYGRSLRSHQVPFDVRDLSEYFPDIDSALLIIRREGARDITLISHSTGGLITSLYCMQPSADREAVDRMVLNSPFLDMNMGWFVEKIVIPVASFYGRFFPNTKVSQGSDISPYSQSLLREYHGEWEFNTEWKRSYPEPLTTGWLRAIHNGHRTVQQADGQITIPILLMYSDKSLCAAEWSEAFGSADCVLDVEDIAKYGARLGSQVTSVEVEDGIHDLVLSRPDVRESLYQTVFDWME